MGREWRSFLGYLGVKAITIEQAEDENRNNVKEAFFQSLRWWHNGNSDDHPSTWKELLQALVEAELVDDAVELKRKLLNYEI